MALPLSAAGQKDNISSPQTQPDQEEADNRSFSFTDSRGISRLYQEHPGTVISLGPNITETIFALERGNLLIGRTDFCDYPPEVKEITSIGSLMEPNMETIVNLNPDLVIASTHVSPEVLEKLESYGIPTVLVYGEESFQGMEDVISGCAILLDAELKGNEILADIRKRLKAVIESVEQNESPSRCYYALGFGAGGDWTAGGSTFIGELMTLAGGENIAFEQEGWSYSKEWLVEKQPEVIILNRGMKKEFLSLPIYKDLEASRNNRVFEIDENILVRQGPRQIEALEELASIMVSGLDQP